MKSTLDYALDYLSYGIPAIPSDPKTKIPLIKWTEYQSRLPTKEETITMFRQYPKAMISLITGKISNLIIVDADSQKAIEIIDAAIPDYVEAVIDISPRGGRHYWWTMNGRQWQTKTAVLPHIDIRANGGCIVAPPSRNASGGQYRWLNQLEFDPRQLQPMPESLCQLLQPADAKPKFAVNPGEIKELFTEGRRDNDLFHLALALRKAGESKEYILQVLINFTKSWKDNNSVKYLSEKVASAFQHEERRDKSWVDEIREWANNTTGYFHIKNCYDDLQVQTKEHKAIIKVNLGRLVNDKILERDNGRNGWYRKVDTNLERIDWENASDEHLNIKLPLGVTDYCNINPSNILVVAGCKDSGKSAFCLNTAILNIDRYKINYYSNEMGDVEIKRRLKKVQIQLQTPMESLRKINFFKRLDNFADVIEDNENTIHIIDYIDVTKDSYLIGEVIKTIFAKLKKSVCLIALQKDYGKDLARGGASSLDKARIYLTLERGIAKIISGKDWVKEDINPAGLLLSYKLIQGCKFYVTSDWK